MSGEFEENNFHPSLKTCRLCQSIHPVNKRNNKQVRRQGALSRRSEGFNPVMRCMVTFKDAVASCLMQYTSVNGRASRSEFWWFLFFLSFCSGVIYLIGLALPEQIAPVLQGLLFIATAIPLFSVYIRRLHDIGASAWRIVPIFIPVLNFFCLYWVLKKGDPSKNFYGPAPE